MQGYSGTIIDDNVFLGHEELSMPYFINCCGYLKSNGIDAYLKRNRKDFYLVYIINGAGHFKFDGKYVTAEAGSIIVYKPGEEQDYYYVGDDKAEIYWIHFTGYDAKNLTEKLLMKKNIYKVGIDPESIRLFEVMIHEIQIKKPNYHMICIGYLVQMLSQFSRKATFIEKGEGIFKNDNIENAIKLMHMEFQMSHDINYYARKSNLCVYQFIRNFKKATQLPPAKYIEKLRINKAKELLIDTNLTINEIANEVGYNDAFYFSKAFKKITNFSPTEFRNKIII